MSHTETPETEMSHTETSSALSGMLRQHEVEQFYFHETALLDARDYQSWVELFTDDTHYFMPIRRTRTAKELDREFTKPGEMAFFDDTKPLLEGRVMKLATGRSWSEDPPSRTRHLITNVRVTADDGNELEVASNFHLYRTRLNNDEDHWIGSRADLLRRDGDGLRIARRYIYLEQTVLTAANLSVFF